MDVVLDLLCQDVRNGENTNEMGFVPATFPTGSERSRPLGHYDIDDELWSNDYVILTKGSKRKEGGGTLIVSLILEGYELQNEHNTIYSAKREIILQIFEILSTF